MPNRSDRRPEVKPVARSPRQARDLERKSVIRHVIDRVMKDLERRFDDPAGVSPRQSDVH
jgi:hypothetical protein